MHGWYRTMRGAGGQDRSPAWTGLLAGSGVSYTLREHTRKGEALTEWARNGLPSARSGRRRLMAESIRLATNPNVTCETTVTLMAGTNRSPGTLTSGTNTS